MLIFDAFHGYITEKIKLAVEMNTDLVIIPGGMTSQLHVVVNGPFMEELQ